MKMLEDNDLIKADFVQRLLSDQFQWHISEQDQGCDQKCELCLVHTDRSQINLMTIEMNTAFS